MATAIPARLSPAEGRRFGLVVGAAFLVLGGLSLWRGHDVAPYVLGSVGLALILAGIFIAGRLGPLYRVWMRLAILLSKVTTPIFMGVIYFLVLTPVGMVRRLLSRNPLHAAEVDGSFWVTRKPGEGSPDSMSRQY